MQIKYRSYLNAEPVSSEKITAFYPDRIEITAQRNDQNKCWLDRLGKISYNFGHRRRLAEKPAEITKVELFTEDQINYIRLTVCFT